MRKYLLVVILILGACQLKAQNRHVDSIRYALKQKPQFVVSLHNRYAFVKGSPQQTFGLQTGVDFDKTFRILFGVNLMPKPYQEFKITSMGSVSDTTIQNTNLIYYSLTGEYAFYRSERWKISAPILLGMGIRKYSETRSQVVQKEISNAIFPLEFGVTGIFYFTDWLGIKVGLGNRLTFGKSFATTSGPYYALGISLSADPILKWIRRKSTNQIGSVLYYEK